MIIIQAETKPHMKKKTWHQNLKCKIREEKETPMIYSRVVLENVIRCTAVDMRYLTDAAYIDKLVIQQTILATDVWYTCSHHYLPKDQKAAT